MRAVPTYSVHRPEAISLEIGEKASSDSCGTPISLLTRYFGYA
jgi:hypothetical protein